MNKWILFVAIIVSLVCRTGIAEGGVRRVVHSPYSTCKATCRTPTATVYVVYWFSGDRVANFDSVYNQPSEAIVRICALKRTGTIAQYQCLVVPTE